jgi:hypothetical protein
MERGNPRTRRGPLLAGIVLLIIATLVPTAGTAAAASRGGGTERTPGISKYVLGSLSAAWWKYVLAQPAATNPLFSDTGGGCGDGQAGPVFFLVGSTTEKPVKRTECTVPRGRSLFFPMINTVNTKTIKGETANDLWSQIHDGGGFTVTGLHAEIDRDILVDTSGPDPRYRGCVGPDRACAFRFFVIVLPKDNVFGLPPGPPWPTVADGYYVLVPPLAPGRHSIKFGGNLANGFAQDIAYELTVR